MRDITDAITILNNQAEDGSGNVAQMEGFKHIIAMISATGGADFTLKCQGSISDECPDFTDTPSVSNHWAYLGMIDLENGNPIDGDDGIVFTTNGYKLVEINVSCIKWITFEVSDYTAGTANVKIKGAYS